MKVDFDRILVNFYGKPLKEDVPDPEDMDKTTQVDATLRHIAVNALLGLDQSADGREKMRRYNLAQRVHKSTEPIELKSKDVVLLKKRIGVVYPPLISGQAWEMIEPEESETS